MKKTISLLLALVLCLSLYACGGDEKYTVLLEHLDTGNYEGIKSELSALSPDFKTEQEQMTADAEKLAKYESLIELLEAEDYEGAVADIQNRMPAPEEPVYTEVEITLNNWQDYFEIVEEEKWVENGFGEVENYRKDYLFVLREEYRDKVKIAEGFQLTVEFVYNANYYDATVNLEERELIIGDINYSIGGSPTGEVKDVQTVGRYKVDTTIAATEIILWDDGRQSVYLIETTPTISRIEGSILICLE